MPTFPFRTKPGDWGTPLWSVKNLVLIFDPSRSSVIEFNIDSTLYFPAFGIYIYIARYLLCNLHFIAMTELRRLATFTFRPHLLITEFLACPKTTSVITTSSFLSGVRGCENLLPARRAYLCWAGYIFKFEVRGVELGIHCPHVVS